MRTRQIMEMHIIMAQIILIYLGPSLTTLSIPAPMARPPTVAVQAATTGLAQRSLATTLTVCT